MNSLVYSFHHSAVPRLKFSETPEFDFVVVGGGPAGCALATRLAEAGQHSVLLIEQGTTIEQDPELRISSELPLQTNSLHFTNFDAQYRSSADEPITRRAIDINSGKVLGGSTCINYCIWTRGPKDDYDLWAELVDNRTFSWEGISYIFDRVETFSRPSNPISVRTISQSQRSNPWSEIAAASYEQSGHRRLDSINGGDMLGYSELAESVDPEGNRSSANEYIRKFKQHMVQEKSSKVRLEIWTALKVEKVITECAQDKEGRAVNRCVGVQTSFGVIRARKEVILTAGAIQSPYLLLSSGIGPSDHLTEHDVEVIHDSPSVGQRLWDHPLIDVTFRLNKQSRGDTAEDLFNLMTMERHMDNWVNESKGLMSGLPYEWIGLTNAQSQIEATLTKENHELTPMEGRVLLRSTVPHFENFLMYGHGLTFAQDPRKTSYMSVATVLLAPRSRGSITLSSPTSRGGSQVSEPKIVLNQLKEQVDQDVMVAAVEKAYDIFNTDAWAEYLEPQSKPTREETMDLLKQKMRTLWHLGGTCSMTTKYAQGVVDNELRVQGVEGLRVADTSVIPFPLACHTQAAAYALGELGAQFILQDHSVIQARL